ncbi:MAG: radical SAM protein [Candidatus Rokuibacteriota bacterium]|nr:MAG: radical SAM protein [Candidatus Rokubacteria bacterium]
MQGVKIKPGVPAPTMAARLGDVIDERHKAEYRELRAADLVNRRIARPMPFGNTINPYRGCSSGCVYCYARYTHDFLGHNDPIEFERTIYVKRGDPARLRKSLERARRSRTLVAIGTATDPYQAGEGRFAITRGVLEAAARLPGLRLSITTKGTLVTRDLDLLRTIADRSELSVNFSITTTDVDLARKLEPRAPRPDLRFKAMRALAGAGITTRLFIMPVLPCLTDGEGNLRALLTAARDAGADGAECNVLFLREKVREFFFESLSAHFPELLPAYRELYARSAYVPRDTAREIEARVARLAAEVGLTSRWRADRSETRTRPANQLSLIW